MVGPPGACVRMPRHLPTDRAGFPSLGLTEEREMRFRIIPREEGFYDLFEKAAANLAETARLLLKLMVDFHDPAAAHAEIRQREHEGDEITHQIMRALNTTFVTPFDREDIHRLASGLDDILDFIEAVSDLLVLHRIEHPLPEMRQQADARLFSGDYKAMDVLKWKDLVDQLEAAIDGCEDVANTLESILLKHA